MYFCDSFTNHLRENSDTNKVALETGIGCLKIAYPRHSTCLPNSLINEYPDQFGQNTDISVYTILQFLPTDILDFLKKNAVILILTAIIVFLVFDLFSFKKNNVILVKNLKKKNEDLNKKIGKLGNKLGAQNEALARIKIEKTHGSEFAKGIKFTSLREAVLWLHERGGGNVKDERDVETKLTAIRDLLMPRNDKLTNNEKSEFVTGIQKNILIWYLNQLLCSEKYKNCEMLKGQLEKFPWVIDEKVSLDNVRKCIPLVHTNFSQSLDFLSNHVNREDLHSFISPRKCVNKKETGHGLTFVMHHLYTCISAITAEEKRNLLPFPPSGELEIDIQGSIEIIRDHNRITITLGEIKTSENKIAEAKKQLYRSLMFIAGLHELIAVNDYVYDLVGNIYICERPEGKFPREENTLELPPNKNISFKISYPLSNT